MSQHHTLLIVGGGAAGVSIANTFRRQDKSIDIAIIEPSEKHYYQPGFTIIGGGAYTMKETTRNEADLIHPSVKWLKDYAESFQPEANTVTLRSGEVVSYDYLVVCPGLQLDWQKIQGLQDTIGKNNVCSNYSPDTVEYTWQCIQEMIAKGSGTTLFTQPPMPIKCAGAPQKIMYLAADRFHKKGILNNFIVEFCNAGPAMFGVPFFAKALDKVVADYGIKTHFAYNLVAIDGAAKTATFEVTDADGNKTRVDKTFDMINVTPPQSAPDFIKNSPFANAAGWVDVNDKTLQHTKYANVFSLGDVACTSNAKTAAAVRKQVPVVVDNITNLINHAAMREGYDGYGSCPLTTSLSGVILAEFTYGGKVTPSFPLLDPRKSRWIWWLGKKIGFPWMYWHLMLKGYRFDIPHLASYAEKFVDKDYLIKANAVQIGQSNTATQNFTLAVPSSPDGTIKLARGNSGATTQDVMNVSNAGVVSFPQGLGNISNSTVLSTGSTTSRSLANRFADVVNVKDFGAVGDGVADDTAAFQAAIDYVYSKGGGIVECFETFKINSTINVKENVSLQGQAIYPWAGKSATTFDISGKNSRIILNPSATIQVRNSSGLQGLIINRQGLVTGENPTTWTGTAVTVLGIVGIYEVTILGFNQAIDASSSTNGERSGGSKYFKIWFDCNNGIKQSSIYEMSHMYECMGNDITGATTTYRNGSAFEFSNGVDWSRAIGCFSYGYSRGFKLNNTNNVTLIGCGSDGNGDIGVEIIGTSRTTTISNHTFAAVNTGVYIDNSTSVYPDTQISDSGFHDVSAYGVNVASGNISVTGCSFNRTVSSTGIRVQNNNSYSIIQNNLFYGNGTPLILNGLSQDKSNVSNNKFIGTKDLTTGTFQTFDNTRDSIVYRSWTSAQVGARLVFDKARGDSTTQLTPNNADINTSILGRGYTGTTWGDASWIRSQFVGTPGAANTAGNIIFSVTPVGSLSTIDRVILDADGHISPITDNSITCGRAGQRWSSIWAANGTIQTSDERVKKDIEESKLGLDFVNSLRPVSYKWIEGGKKIIRQVFLDKNGNEIPEDESILEGSTPERIIEESIPGERTHFGLLAQEVKAALPDGVDFGGWVLTDKENPDSQQALRYDQFIAPLIKAVQEQQKQIEELSAKVAALESK